MEMFCTVADVQETGCLRPPGECRSLLAGGSFGCNVRAIASGRGRYRDSDRAFDQSTKGNSYHIAPNRTGMVIVRVRTVRVRVSSTQKMSRRIAVAGISRTCKALCEIHAGPSIPYMAAAPLFSADSSGVATESFPVLETRIFYREPVPGTAVETGP